MGKTKKITQKKKFLPKNHRQKLYLKLHILKQEDGSVDKYIREFEKLMMRNEMLELKEQTIA